MVKQKLRICFTFVGNSIQVFGNLIQVFGNLAGSLGIFPLKSDQISPKSYLMTMVCKGQCVKGHKFKKLKVSTDYFKRIILVNYRRNPGYLQKISFKRFQYWANACSSRSMKLVRVFCRKNDSKMSRIELFNSSFQ